MRGTLRVGLMVLLTAVLGVGNAWGEWKEYKDGNGIEWEYEEIEPGKTCRIGIPKRNRGSIRRWVWIPGTVEVGGISIKVVSIGADAFHGCSGLMEVTIPSSVTEIGERAFNGCSGLTMVNIPGSVTEIGASAFSGCSGLKLIEVESGNKNYCAESGVLFTKDKATLICYPGGKPEDSYTIPSSVKAIGKYAFRGCSGLKAVTIPEGVTAIGGSAFSGCSGLTAATIPGSVTEIGWEAFRDCSGLTSVTISEGVKTIGDYAFYECSGLTGVTIPDGVTKIGKQAFDGCSGLTGVTIPSSVTEIEKDAFKGCSGLTAVYWLADANCSVEDDAFEEIAFLKTLHVRQGEMAAIVGNGQTWWKKFDKIVEGYVVTFKDSDGHEFGEQLVKPNGTATEPVAPTKKDDTFVEWQLSGKKYDFGAKVTENITLVAKWRNSVSHETAVESAQLAGVRVVQNPVGEVLELDGMEHAVLVEVYSVCGVRVYAESLHGAERVEIDARGWAHGVYVVKVEASDGAKTLRVVK